MVATGVNSLKTSIIRAELFLGSRCCQYQHVSQEAGGAPLLEATGTKKRQRLRLLSRGSALAHLVSRIFIQCKLQLLFSFFYMFACCSTDSCTGFRLKLALSPGDKLTTPEEQTLFCLKYSQNKIKVNVCTSSY